MKKRYILAAILTSVMLYLTHHAWLGTKKSPEFDMMLLIIILFLGYLLSLKITSYIADFKRIQHKSRIDIIFLVVFFSMLLIPMSHINQDKKSEIENKTLAKFQPLITKKGKLNYNFGKDFENWFNDRFALRKEIVRFYITSQYKLTHNVYYRNGYFCNKSNNWMNGVPSTSFFKTIEEYDKDSKNIDKIVKGAQEIQKFCNDNNIKLYILIAPLKFSIYEDKLYPVIKKSNEEEITNHIIQEIKKNTDIDIIYPYKEIKSASKQKDLLYFKSDHHWTDGGAYIAYLELMKHIQKDFPDVYTSKRSDFDYFYSKKIKVEPNKPFHNGRTYEKLFIGDSNLKLLDTKYKYFKHKDNKNLRMNIEKMDWPYFHIKHFSYDKGKDIDILLYGDSMGENLLPILPYSFKKLERIYNPKPDLLDSEPKNTKKLEQHILNTHPKILIVCYLNIERIKHLQYFNYKENN